MHDEHFDEWDSDLEHTWQEEDEDVYVLLAATWFDFYLSGSNMTKL